MSEKTDPTQDGQAQEPIVENGHFSTEDEEKLKKVLTGCLDNLPAQSSKIVRIFTSSTFTGKIILNLLT